MKKTVQWVHALVLCIGMTTVFVGAQDAPPQEQNEASVPVEAVTVPATAVPASAPEEVVVPEAQSATPIASEAAQESPPGATLPLKKSEEPIVAPQEEVPQPPTMPQQPLGPDEVKGIDTVDIKDEEAQGNWLYKRIWYERTLKRYDQIRKALKRILEMRIGFFAKRAELDKNVLDPFYIKIGLSQGELQEMLTELIATTSKKTKDHKEGELLEQAEDEKAELEQLQKEVQQVVKHDNEVEEAILMLVEQLNKMQRLEQEAWYNFKNIAQVLDDKKARELFYKVDNAWRNIQEMQNYIEKTFSSSFDLLVERVKEKIQKIDSAILALKEKGINLKKEVAAEEAEDQEETAEASKGFLSRYIIDPIKRFFSAIWSVIRWPFDKIRGKKSGDAEEHELIEETEAVTPEGTETTLKEEAILSPIGKKPAETVEEEIVTDENE